jgi:hypothetical protein
LLHTQEVAGSKPAAPTENPQVRAPEPESGPQAAPRWGPSGARKGGSGKADPLPSPDHLDREVRDLVVRALALRAEYRSWYLDGLEPHGHSEVGVPRTGGGHSNPTEGTWASPSKRYARESCRRSAKWIREAAGNLLKAERALAPAKEQPREVSADAVVDQGSFDRSLHLQREREMRGEG